MKKNSNYTIEDITDKNIPLGEIVSRDIPEEICKLNLLKLKDEEEINVVWDDYKEYSQLEHITEDQIEYIKLATFNDLILFDFMDWSEGFIELKEGLFYFDYVQKIFKIVRWNTKNKRIRNRITNAVIKEFRKYEDIERDIEEDKEEDSRTLINFR